MKAKLIKQIRHGRRKRGIRRRVFGVHDRPRLTVYRSLKHIYAQIIDDLDGRTLVEASSAKINPSAGGNRAAGAEVGKILAQRAKAAGINRVTMDRNGFRYHGRVKALADAARAEGIAF